MTWHNKNEYITSSHAITNTLTINSKVHAWWGMKMHVENSLALVGFHDITSQELEIDKQQSDHCSTSYLFN